MCHHLHIAGITFLAVFREVHEFHRVTIDTAFPDLIHEALGAAVQVVGAVVDGKGVLLAVQGELALGNAVGKTAGHLAHAGAVSKVVQGIGITQDHVLQLAVFVRNYDGSDGGSNVTKFYVCAGGVFEGVEKNFLTLRSGSPQFLFDIHMLAFINDKFKTVARFRVRMGLGGAYAFPHLRVYLREKDIGILHLRVHVRDIQPVHQRQGCAVHGGAAHHEAFFRPGGFGLLEGLFKGIHAGGFRDVFAAQVQDDVLAPGKRMPGQGEVSGAAHDHGIAASGAFEILQILRNVPGEVVLYADAPVVGYGYY